ncbi:MAG: acetyltransferase [Ignavibacteria bacterium]|jgi:sugar O-acyltransferase (sialic acid O-acetyltransferase NeuD family)
MEEIVIIGAGGMGREILDVIEYQNTLKTKWNFLGFVDEDPKLLGLTVREYPVLGDITWFEDNYNCKIKIIIGIGNNYIRRIMVNQLLKYEPTFASLIHPSVNITKQVKLGPGSVILAGCTLTNNITIGEHVIVNIGTSISHDSNIKNFVNLCPGVHISGNNLINEDVYMGTGSLTINDIIIGKGTYVGAGAVVTKSLPEYVLAIGIPAKPIKKLDDKING